MDIDIQTYWNVETLYMVLNAVASVMAGSGFEGLLKMVFIFAIGIGMFAFTGDKQIDMAKWFIQALVFTTILNMPIARVAITDRTNLEPPKVVDHVPFILAVIAQTTNLAFGFLTGTYETVFGVPDDLGLQKGDVGFGHRILKQVNNAVIRDPELRSDIMQYFKECTLYDVKDGVITPQQIIGETDTWNVIFSNTSPARFVTYNTLSSTPVTDTCTNVAIVLKTRVNSAVTAGQTFYGKQAFSRASTDAIATSMFVSVVGTSYDWILNNSVNASDAMKQAMFNNIWREAGSELPTLLNDPARVAEVNALAGAAQAARQANGSNSTLSLLAQETLPQWRNWLEAIIFAIFPVVVVMMVVVSTEGAKKILGGYLMSLAWIGLWPVLFAVINHLSLMHMQYKARALELAAGVPFQLSDVFDATLSDEQTMIGYMVVLVPFIAGGIIRLGQGGFMSVADRMMTGFSSAATAVGAGMAGGNVSMGQAGVDTASVNSTSMHRFDSNIGLSGGGATIGRGDGSTATMAANGTVALQQLHNRMLTQMGLDKRFSSDRNQEAHRTDITSDGDQLSTRRGDAATLTKTKGHEDSRGSFQQTGTQVGTTTQGGHGGQHVTGQNVGRTFRENTNFNAQTGASDNWQMNVGAGRGGSTAAPSAAGGGGGADPQDERRLVDAMKQGGASQPQIDQALHKLRGSKGGAPSAGGSVINAGLGLNSQKNYSATHGRNRDVTNQHGEDESAHKDRHYSVTGTHTQGGSTGKQSGQNDRSSRDAALSKVDERTTVKDVSDRNEYGVGHRLSRNESESFTVHRDLMADPHLFDKVAARNGMTAMRFANQSEESIMQMMQDYVSEKGMVAKAKDMPTQTFAGESLPTTPEGLKAESNKDRVLLPNDVTKTYQSYVAQTGYSGTKPLVVDTAPPPIIAESQAAVDDQLDPRKKNSIPARAAKLDEHVNAVASPDKPLGEGRANPMAVVEDMEWRDVKDYAGKVWDKITGDEVQYNENQQRLTDHNLPINTSTKK